MVAASRTLRMTYREYLAFEAASETKHEYLRGEVFATPGGTYEHGRLAANVLIELGRLVRGRPCVALNPDVRIRVVETDKATYPDASVVCGKPLFAPDDASTSTASRSSAATETSGRFTSTAMAPRSS